MNQTITLEIDGKDDISFLMTLESFSRFQNETTPSNKVAPMNNLLNRTVIPEHKEYLKELLLIPTMNFVLGSALIEDFVPEVQVSVKKPSK